MKDAFSLKEGEAFNRKQAKDRGKVADGWAGLVLRNCSTTVLHIPYNDLYHYKKTKTVVILKFYRPTDRPTDQPTEQGVDYRVRGKRGRIYGYRSHVRVGRGRI